MVLIQIVSEPTVAVGLMSNAAEIRFDLHGAFAANDHNFNDGSWRATLSADQQHIVISGENTSVIAATEITLRPLRAADASFTIHDIVIGIDFHWERKESQSFRGALKFKAADGALLVSNEVSVEDYLASVISSEMSASAHDELLKAHSVISRSWLLAQLAPWRAAFAQSSLDFGIRKNARGEHELIRWYDKENHSEFDVCADDHCQRYQGITKALKSEAGAAGLQKVQQVIRTTFGQVLAFGDGICDARFSKSCGGMMEEFSAAWQDVNIPYLQALYDGEQFPAQFALPLNDEANATAWISHAPPAFCNTDDQTMLQRILPDFDQETTDFYRWRVTIPQDELQALLLKKLGIDFGAIRALEPVERGASGRLKKLRIVGEKETLIIGKELEIRRALSPSHLYSSAFIVRTEGNDANVPDAFTLMGAGWGHGVGLCQIGAALMAERSYRFEQILSHYYPGSELFQLYPLPADAVN